MSAIAGMFKRWVVRPIMFGLPLPLVAGWCDLQPTWQLFAWTFFCIVWSDFTDDIGKERSDVGDRKVAARPAPVLLTRAQLAAIENPLRSRDAEKGKDNS